MHIKKRLAHVMDTKKILEDLCRPVNKSGQLD